jgi:MFS superfamily sulfate permease-like transporter
VVETLGKAAGTPGFHALRRNPSVKPIPGILIFRFNAPIIFFNAPYFRKTALDAVADATPGVRWFVLDAIPVSHIDVTGWHAVTELMEQLLERDIRFVIAGRRTQIRGYALRAGITADQLEGRLFPTMAVRRYREENSARETTEQPATSDPPMNAM